MDTTPLPTATKTNQAGVPNQESLILSSLGSSKMTPQTATRKSQSLRDTSHGSPVAWRAASMLQGLARAVHCFESFLAAQHTEFCWQDNVSVSCIGIPKGLERDLIHIPGLGASSKTLRRVSLSFDKGRTTSSFDFPARADEGSFMSSKLQRNYSFLDKNTMVMLQGEHVLCSR